VLVNVAQAIATRRSPPSRSRRRPVSEFAAGSRVRRVRSAGHLPPLRHRHDGRDYLLGHRVLEHVPRTRNQAELGAGDGLMEPQRMAIDADDVVFRAGHEPGEAPAALAAEVRA
jgi:hypothetical protein